MLFCAGQLVWDVMGARAQPQVAGTRPTNRPTTPPAHTCGSRSARPHHSRHNPHALHSSGAHGACKDGRAPERTPRDALPSHGSRLQRSSPRESTFASRRALHRPPSVHRRCAIDAPRRSRPPRGRLTSGFRAFARPGRCTGRQCQEVSLLRRAGARKTSAQATSCEHMVHAMQWFGRLKCGTHSTHSTVLTRSEAAATAGWVGWAAHRLWRRSRS